MANLFTVPNPYTQNIPGGTLTKVELVNPRNVAVAWPNRSGGNVPNTHTTPTFLTKLFG